MDITGTSAEENGLSVISYETKKVTVTIQGNRSSIGSLSADDLVASAVVENVTSAGEKYLKINVISKKSDVKFDVTSVSPSTMAVMFDKIDTREFELSVEAPNVIVNNEQELDTAYTFHSSEVVLYDKNESKIDTKNITFNTNDFTIDIPVYMQKKLDLSYDLRYAPANFDADSLSLEMNVNTINVASPNTELEKINTWNIGSIPLYDIDWDFNKSFELEIPENYKNLSNISTVTVKLNTDGLAKKTVTVNDISILNAPTNYNCTVNSYGLVFDIIGPEEDIAEITEKDILVSVDLLKYTVQSSNFTADATISFPNYDKVWAVGLQKVSIEAEPITTENNND